jgi:hypothetical protein
MVRVVDPYGRDFGFLDRNSAGGKYNFLSYYVHIGPILNVMGVNYIQNLTVEVFYFLCGVHSASITLWLALALYRCEIYIALLLFYQTVYVQYVPTGIK